MRSRQAAESPPLQASRLAARQCLRRFARSLRVWRVDAPARRARASFLRALRQRLRALFARLDLAGWPALACPLPAPGPGTAPVPPDAELGGGSTGGNTDSPPLGSPVAGSMMGAITSHGS